jgi:preprotein translocase subunit SecG
MITFITAIHVTTVVLLVITVLLQSGKGAEISATFGGSSQTVFGSSGGANFFQKLTYTLAAVFMTTSIILTVLPGHSKRSVFEGYTAPANTSLPSGGTAPNGNAPSLPTGGDAPAATGIGVTKTQAANKAPSTTEGGKAAAPNANGVKEAPVKTEPSEQKH